MNKVCQIRMAKLRRHERRRKNKTPLYTAKEISELVQIARAKFKPK